MEREELETMLRRRGFPYDSFDVLFELPGVTVHGVWVSRGQPLNHWRSLRALTSETGYWPVLIGDEDDLRIYRDGQAATHDAVPAEVLARAETLDAGPWLEDTEGRRPPWSATNVSMPRGDWPQVLPEIWSAAPSAGDLEAAGRSAIFALVPARAGWESPALLLYGGWGAVPLPEHNAAVLRRWEQLYGADVVALTRDMVEVYLADPPRDQARALQLAHELHMYCPDFLGAFGMETLDELAAVLMGSERMMCWWD